MIDENKELKFRKRAQEAEDEAFHARRHAERLQKEIETLKLELERAKYPVEAKLAEWIKRQWKRVLYGPRDADSKS